MTHTDNEDDARCEDCGYLFRHPAFSHCDVQEKHAAHNKVSLIVWAIEDNLRDRRGIRHEWDNVDKDVQDEIRDTLMEKVRTVLGDDPKQDRSPEDV